MWTGPRAPIIPAMSLAPTSSKVILIADRRTDSAATTSTPVRRYRLARLRFETRPEGRGTDFEHLKRAYD
jgi:hypothetical protein